MTLTSISRRVRPALLAAALAIAPAALAADAAPVHWGYDDVASPAQWAAIAPACKGSLQSPIDLWSSSVTHEGAQRLKAAYHRVPFAVINNGHTLQATPQGQPLNSIELDGETFTLAQFHVHTPSEHTVDGKAHDMELHLVHTSASGKVAVVAVFYDIGDANPALGELFDRTPGELSHAGERIALYSTLDPADLLPAHSNVVHYTGSLTTPPCTEGVLWNVEMTPQQLSAEQLDALRFVFPHNARPVQPFNQRTLVDEPGR